MKYHHGATGTYVTPIGTKINVELANNPSHLEAVDGVVEGMTRCLQTDQSVNIARFDAQIAAPILIHGDAAFAAQGVVAEVLNLQALAGLLDRRHDPHHLEQPDRLHHRSEEGRSTRYASDLAKGYDLPIVHVNADDVEACIAAVHLAIDYRRKFGRDVLIDLIGYRRFGHNEQDEPAYTQPQMYEAIKSHPTVRELFAARLSRRACSRPSRSPRCRTAATSADGRGAPQRARARRAQADRAKVEERRHARRAVQTGVDARAAAALVATSWSPSPTGFTLKQEARDTVRASASRALQLEGEVDWGLAEGLAFAALLERRDADPA